MSSESTKTRPVRVLHIIDTLGGGGSERLVWDIVRLSEQTRVKHRVVTIFPEGYLAAPVYAEPLRQLGAYGSTALPQKSGSAIGPGQYRNAVASGKSSVIDVELRPDAIALRYRPGPTVAFEPKRRRGRNLPPAFKKPLVSIWNFAYSISQHTKRIAAHVPSMMTIPAEYFRFRPDIIHTHGFYGFKYGLLFKTLFRRPLVHMVPALFSQMEAQGTGWLVSRYRRFHRHVDRFALDPGYRSELRGIGVPDEKLLDVNGTLDLEAIASVKTEHERHRLEVRRKLRIPDDALIGLSVGRLDPTKGHLYALEALPSVLKQFPNLHWVVLGEGTQRLELEQRSKELGVETHTHLTGFDPDPLPYYAAADLYLRTTTMEGENISSRQAIAMGLPTVGFDNGCETDLIPKLGHGILVANADAVALGAATCRILSSPDRGASVGALGIDYCKAQMGIQKHVDDLLSLYNQLHSKGAHPVNPVILSNN